MFWRTLPPYPSKHFSFSKLKDVFSVTIFRLPSRVEDVFKKSSRRVCNTSSKSIFKTSSRRLPRRLQNVFKTYLRGLLFKTSSRRLQDDLENKKRLHWRRPQNFFKTSSVRLHQDNCFLGKLPIVFHKIRV